MCRIHIFTCVIMNTKPQNKREMKCVSSRLSSCTCLNKPLQGWKAAAWSSSPVCLNMLHLLESAARICQPEPRWRQHQLLLVWSGAAADPGVRGWGRRSRSESQRWKRLPWKVVAGWSSDWAETACFPEDTREKYKPHLRRKGQRQGWCINIKSGKTNACWLQNEHAALQNHSSLLIHIKKWFSALNKWVLM